MAAVDASVWISSLIPKMFITLDAVLRLRGADATYVAVAQRLDLPLITWDREQLERASRLITVRSPVESA